MEKANCPKTPEASMSVQDAEAVGLLKKKRKLLKNVENKRNINEPCKLN
jgi:hypothetical protein